MPGSHYAAYSAAIAAGVNAQSDLERRLHTERIDKAWQRYIEARRDDDQLNRLTWRPGDATYTVPS